MAAQQALFLFCLFLPGALLSEAAKILTVSLMGGSHCLLMDQVSRILQDHGHNVTLFQQEGLSLLSGYEYTFILFAVAFEEYSFNLDEIQAYAFSILKRKKKTYQVISWFPPEGFRKKFMKSFNFFVEEALHGRETFEQFLKLMELLGIQCSHLLRRRDIVDSLKNENFKLVVVGIFDYCPFLIAEKLGKPFLSILPSSFGTVDFGLPSPVSYVPTFHSLLTGRMDFWGRMKNILMFFGFSRKQWQIHSCYDNTIKEHFPEGSRPVLSHLLRKADLFVNSDFAFDFARPLLPNTVYVGGLMAKPIKPVPQSWLWWAHSSICLLVTHGGQNSIMEATQHGVPMVGMPLFGDQPENLLRVEAKNLGVSILINQLKAGTLALMMKQVIEDKRCKSAAMAASIIRRSHPLSPSQRLVGWIDHILQTGGGAHLKPYAFQQPWREQNLLNVFLFLLGITLGSIWLCGRLGHRVGPGS
ncbi:LOW QUALITY PROTEIN: UDP-glucuronosyltransferase 3A1-like [Dugong dugon]